MPVSFRNYIKVLIAACLVVSFCLVEADAQTRRKKRTRRTTQPVARPVITNPPIAPADATPPAESSDTGDVKIISTADSTQEPTEATDPKKAKTPASPEKEEMQQTITTLSNQVNKLTDRLTQMQEDDRYQLDMERLTRAEQRAEQLRSQLIEIQAKIADFEAKLEQIEWALRPENIETSTAGYGSTRPEAARDARRKQLEGERGRLLAQLKLTQTSRTRLEVAVGNADAEVDHLRMKLNQRREQMDSAPANETPAKPRKPE
jgi:DNA repair exonuclease SbcCD ATPase subunit